MTQLNNFFLTLLAGTAMRNIKTEILIKAPIEKVWSALTDFSNYSTWNPFIRKIEGTFQKDAKLEITIQPAGQKSMIFRPQIININTYQFEWLGQLGIPGIFDGQHRFELQPNSNEEVRFLHSENFSGLLSTPIFYLMNKSAKAGFEEMNQALKIRCEK
jgi:hypothetical protein